MTKAIQKKKDEVAQVSEKFKSSKSIVSFEYHGLTVHEFTSLRKKLNEEGCALKILKNNISRRAAETLGFKKFAKELVGPNAIGIGQDEVSLIKVLSEFAKTNNKLVIKSGVVNEQEVDVEYLNKLSQIPPRDQLLTVLALGMLHPLRTLGVGLKMVAEQKENK